MLFKTLAYLLLIIIILSRPEATFQYAYEGLYQWAAKMVPTLFPFMMISSIMVYSGADLELGRMLSHVLKKLYRYSSYGLYALFMGFFCGFPMGAKVVSDLYEKEKISRSEADTLLSFCNNIGPAYFMGIIIPILHECGYQNTLPRVWDVWDPGSLWDRDGTPARCRDPGYTFCRRAPSHIRHAADLAGRITQKILYGQHTIPHFIGWIYHLYQRVSNISGPHAAVCQQQKSAVQFSGDHRRCPGSLYDNTPAGPESFLDHDSTVLWRHILYHADEQLPRKIRTVDQPLSETQSHDNADLRGILFCADQTVLIQETGILSLYRSCMILDSVYISYRLYALKISVSFLPYPMFTDTVIEGLPFVHGCRSDHVRPLSYE